MIIDLDEEATVEIVAKALMDVERRRELEAVAAINFDCSAFETAASMLAEATPRETVVVGWALISHCLDFAIRQHVSHGSKKELAELLDGLGPIATDAAKLRLAKALGWLPPEMFDATNAVRKLRNKVAHQIVPNEDVDCYAIAPTALQEHVERLFDVVFSHAEEKSGLKLRGHPIADHTRAKCAILTLANDLLGSIVFGPARLRLGLTGATVFFDKDDGPPWWRDVSHATARAAITVIRADVARSAANPTS